MKIILVGGGKVGTALARQLSEEDHNVTIVDTNKARVEHLTESYDVLGIVGNGSSITTLAEAGIEDADVFIAVTGSDELNLLCCMFAKKAGHCHAIARVRNPSYSHELDFIKKQIGISAIINPEMAAAKEISHLLRFPGASKIDTFADGRVRLIKFALTAEQGLDGVAIREIPTRLKSDILVCAVERSGGVIIPNGNFVLQNGDQVTFLATQDKAHEFFQRIHLLLQFHDSDRLLVLHFGQNGIQALHALFIAFGCFHQFPPRPPPGTLPGGKRCECRWSCPAPVGLPEGSVLCLW